MPLSKVDIGNRALSHIGNSRTIESFTEGSVEAQQVDIWYDASVEQVLEAHDWSFARKRQSLAAHVIDPPEGIWAYRYQYPADCVIARQIENPFGVPNVRFSDFPLAPQDNQIPFTVEIASDGTYSILTNVTPATLVYTFFQTNIALYSRAFSAIVALLLSSYIAFPLTTKKKIADDQLAKYNTAILLAPAIDANQGTPPPPPEAEATRARW